MVEEGWGVVLELGSASEGLGAKLKLLQGSKEEVQASEGNDARNNLQQLAGSSLQ